jgi:hypothetical protein
MRYRAALHPEEGANVTSDAFTQAKRKSRSVVTSSPLSGPSGTGRLDRIADIKMPSATWAILFDR